MIVRVIRVHVKPEFIDRFETETKANHEGSLTEPGVLRFDVLRDPKAGGEYLLYEVYASHAASEAHKQTEHYARWKESVTDMMSAPRESDAFEVVAPAEEAGWRSRTD